MVVRYSDHHLNTGPLGDQTTFDHLNTRLVRYSDPHCTVDLKPKLSRFQMVEKRLACKWYGFQMGYKIQNPGHLKPRQMAPTLSMLSDERVRELISLSMSTEQLKMVVQNISKVNREHACICSGVLWTWLDQTEWSRNLMHSKIGLERSKNRDRKLNSVFGLVFGQLKNYHSKNRHTYQLIKLPGLYWRKKNLNYSCSFFQVRSSMSATSATSCLLPQAQSQFTPEFI